MYIWLIKVGFSIDNFVRILIICLLRGRRQVMSSTWSWYGQVWGAAVSLSVTAMRAVGLRKPGLLLGGVGLVLCVGMVLKASHEQAATAGDRQPEPWRIIQSLSHLEASISNLCELSQQPVFIAALHWAGALVKLIFVGGHMAWRLSDVLQQCSKECLFRVSFLLILDMWIFQQNYSFRWL